MNILREVDLSVFRIFPGNRPIDKGNLNKLKLSIEERNLLEQRPILVNQQMQVLDGQHRLQAAKDLGLPIYYLVKAEGDYRDIILMNENQRNWKNEDFLRLYSEGLKNPNYEELTLFLKDHNFDLRQGLLIVNGPIKQMKEHSDFRSGQFKFSLTREQLDETADKVKAFWAILAEHGVKPLHRFKSTACLKPFLLFITMPQVKWETFLSKLEVSWYKLGVRPSVNLYLDMFCDIYNYRTQNKVHLS